MSFVKKKNPKSKEGKNESFEDTSVQCWLETIESGEKIDLFG